MYGLEFGELFPQLIEPAAKYSHTLMPVSLWICRKFWRKCGSTLSGSAVNWATGRQQPEAASWVLRG